MNDRAARPSSALFPAVAFASATLVFLVQPMVSRLMLPLLGGSASVWNTSMAFFQIALLAGYGYAHALQRAPSVRTQAAIHVVVLLAAAVALPLRVNGLAGPPDPDHPALWLLAALALSVGAPFAALSATAPLVQAWYARTMDAGDGPDHKASEPYALYAASNIGSLAALVAYPVLVEPLTTLAGQRAAWSLGYGLFILLMAVLAVAVSQSKAAPPAASDMAAAAPVSWARRLGWIGLAAVPCSLMLGVTTYLTTDVASAPFLWVAPLALYLATFIIAFQARPAIGPEAALALQAGAVVVCAALLPFRTAPLLLQLAVHLITFFLTALICHQALVARRPPAARLTEFYLCLSIGGVLGGAFNAFLAPVIFDNVWEYPIVLTLACLARPWRRRWDAAPVMVVLVAAISIGAELRADRTDTRQTWRSFFGVLRQEATTNPSLGGAVRVLAHGTTLHGAQATEPAHACQPLVYYTPSAPIGQAILAVQATRPAMTMGAVGLGTGSVAAYVRPGDRLSFFEIDPLVVRVASDPRHFSYTTRCAKGPVDYTVGDARLTVARRPAGSFDLLLIDAFSSDAVPTHLLTVEAIRGYLGKLKPDGVLVLHLTNRNLDLEGPAQAAAVAAGGVARLQEYRPAPGARGWEVREDALVVARSEAAVARFAADPRWRPADPHLAAPWTDDYTNLAGALWRKLKARWRL